MCAHRLPNVGNSYWSKRRRIQLAVQSHMNDLDTAENSEIRDNTSNDIPDFHIAHEFESHVTEPCDTSNSVHAHDVNYPELDGWSECSDAISDCNSSGSQSDNELTDESLRVNLAKWAVDFNVNRDAVGELLKLLHPHHPQLPLDHRTLLSTPRSTSVCSVAGGVYHHIGIESCLLKLFQSGMLPVTGTVSIQINIDGLPLFKSSSMQLWPILGLVKEPSIVADPFVIGVFAGQNKPTAASDYLKDFVTELRNLCEHGFLHCGAVVFVRLHSIVCDAPARSFLKNVKSFTGYHGCERCIQRGKYYLGRMTFPETSSELRTDERFLEMVDEDHHLSNVPSPFTELNVGMVTGFVLDYMHLVCLGVVRRLLLVWLRGPLPLRLPASSVSVVNSNLISLQSYTPCEFARKPRSLSDIDRWKATEFRQLLLFTGPLVLKDVLPEQLYHNFLLLHVAISCLVNPHFCNVYCDFARKLLVKFVKHCEEIYGQEFVVYNVHSLIHLPDDVKRFGSLNNISCFPFENYLHSVKKLVHSPFLPLQQVVNRVCERQCQLSQRKQHTDCPILKGILHQQLTGTEYNSAVFYSSVETTDFTLSIRDSDSCVWLNDNRIGIIQHIMQTSEKISLVVRLFDIVASFYNYPLDSKQINIVILKNLTHTCCTYMLTDVKYKCTCMPAKDKSFVAVPM